jgi:hypothetical protein
MGQQAVVPDAHEPGGHDVEEEAAEEFGSLQFHKLRAALGCIVCILQAHDAVADQDQA